MSNYDHMNCVSPTPKEATSHPIYLLFSKHLLSRYSMQGIMLSGLV